jgi:hypothetical protein
MRGPGAGCAGDDNCPDVASLTNSLGGDGIVRLRRAGASAPPFSPDGSQLAFVRPPPRT